LLTTAKRHRSGRDKRSSTSTLDRCAGTNNQHIPCGKAQCRPELASEVSLTQRSCARSRHPITSKVHPFSTYPSKVLDTAGAVLYRSAAHAYYSIVQEQLAQADGISGLAHRRSVVSETTLEEVLPRCYSAQRRQQCIKSKLRTNERTAPL
jgi:hypothetical protein